MILSLFDQCRLKIRGGIEGGEAWAVKNLYRLPPALRQSILDIILMHGTINNPNCVIALSSPEFLDGMTTLSMEKGDTDDHKYLDHVATNLAKSTGGGVTVGAGIEKLELNLYRVVQGDRNVEEKDACLRNVIRVIAQCSRLENLKIRLVSKVNDGEPFKNGKFSVGIFSAYSCGPGLLNQSKLTESCASVMENLKELMVIGVSYMNLLQAEQPVFNFKRLTSIHFSGVTMSTGAFHKILRSSFKTLTALYLEGFNFAEDSDDGPYFLPFPLPNLKSLTMKDDGFWIRLYRPFIETVLRCPRLEHVDLDMIVEKEMEDEICLRDLNKLGAALEVSLRLRYFEGVRPIFDGPKRFRFIDLFGTKIKFFEFQSMDECWDLKFTSAMAHMVRKCKNLTGIRLHTPDESKLKAKSLEELRNGKLTLGPLFADPGRAARLTEIVLTGSYDPKILQSIVENCLNVNFFAIWSCPDVTDDHFIEWANRGVRLENISIEKCPGISDDGLVPVLVNSARKLLYFWFRPSPLNPTAITDRMWTALVENCRYVKMANIPDHLKGLATQKCFNVVTSKKVKEELEDDDGADGNDDSDDVEDEAEENENEFGSEGDWWDQDDWEEGDEDEEDEDV